MPQHQLVLTVQTDGPVEELAEQLPGMFRDYYAEDNPDHVELLAVSLVWIVT